MRALIVVLLFPLSVYSQDPIELTVKRELKIPLDPLFTGARTRAFADLLNARTNFQKFLLERQLSAANLQIRQLSFVADMQMKRVSYASAQVDLAIKLQSLREKIILVNELQRQILLMRQEEARIRIKSANISRACERIKRLKYGWTNRGEIRWYWYIFQEGVPADVMATIMKQAVPANARDSVNFRYNFKTIKKVPRFEGENLGQLVWYVQKQNCSFAPFKPAHILVLNSLAKAILECEKKKAKLTQEMIIVRSRYSK